MELHSHTNKIPNFSLCNSIRSWTTDGFDPSIQNNKLITAQLLGYSISKGVFFPKRMTKGNLEQ